MVIAKRAREEACKSLQIKIKAAVQGSEARNLSLLQGEDSTLFLPLIWKMAKLSHREKRE